MSVRILTGDARQLLATLPDASVQCCVTSPPYYSLRDYGVEGQIGLEQTPDAYVAEMVAVFREVRRVLADDGTLWLNIGDSYANGGRTTRDDDDKSAGRAMSVRPADGAKPKDLLGIPWAVAFALRADGWWLRSDIIWAKPNPMPESVTSRPTSAHEHVFLLSKRASYFWDQDAVREEHSREWWDESVGPGYMTAQDGRNDGGKRQGSGNPAGRNIRNVWTIATQPFSAKGYDFAGADYVDDHGIPRKLSPDCRVHGLRGQPRPETLSASVCGGPQADPCSRTSTDDHLALEQPHAADPTESYRGSSASDNRSRRTVRSTSGNRTPALPPSAEEDGTPSSSSGIQQPDAQPMLGFDPHVAAQIASASSTQSHRTDPGSRSLLRDIASASLPQNTSHSGPEPGETQLCERTRESKSGADRPASHETLTAPSEPASRTPRTQSGKSSKQDKCSCPVSKVDHFAVMPPALASICIRAGTSERGQCPRCASPWARMVERTFDHEAAAEIRTRRSVKHDASRRDADNHNLRGSELAQLTTRLDRGWQPTCACPEHKPVPQTVLDPFAGAGTTGLVADRLGRNAILIELNPQYADLARDRLRGDCPMFAEVA